MRHFLGWSYIVIKVVPTFPGDRPLMVIGFKYTSCKFLRCIDTEGDGSTDPGKSYLSGFHYTYSNVYIPPISPS